MKYFAKILKVTVSLFLAVTSVTTLLPGSRTNVSAAEPGVSSMDYPIVADAYIRSGGNANKNYNYENITKAHGGQYVGKGYRVINVKSSGDEIMSVMKFSLPTKEEVEAKAFDKFEFQFHIFKNADYNTGNQSYRFYYTTDVDWKEDEITWNNKPKSIKPDGENPLFVFDIEKGFEYESKTDEEKTITVDITNIVEDLIDQEVDEITVFASAKNKMNTSLMIHDRTSGQSNTNENGAYAPKIIASHEGITLAMLNALVDECSAINKDDYTEASFTSFTNTLTATKAFIATNPTDKDNAREIRDWYKKLEDSKKTLVFNGDVNDPDNVAYHKATRSNLNKKETYKVTDGDVNTVWKGKFFPSYVDVDLMDTYAISDIQLYFPKDKIIYYTLYGSNDGKKYDELYQSRSDTPKGTEPDKIIFDSAENYRIVRVYLEYTENESSAYLSEIKVHGEKQNTNTEQLRQGTFEEITNIKDFKDTEYANPITTEETIENVYGIIDRTIGEEYRDWFSFEITPNEKNSYDYFELSDVDGKIHIKGNEGLSLSTGLNYYYKNYVNVQISEQTMQVDMPEDIVHINGVVRKETPMKVRYAFNYCTLSYTFAFFGEEEWQRENDWLALNGVNVVLDLAGQEATWIKFLMNFGYSFDDAKDWLTGPGYYAWQFMDNMEVFGGPIPDGYIIDRVELARSTQRWKNSLGMQTVLQGYAGMIPTNFADFYDDENLPIKEQGSWGGFSRPSMIGTDTKYYDEFAEKFYEAQEFIYGNTTDYYAVDPFHEGGKRPEGLTDDIIAEEVLESLLKYDQDAVWTVQAWQKNPTNALLQGMKDNRKDHVLIVDLIKYPIEQNLNYQKTNYTSPSLDAKEFNGTSWAWCLLGNFGGNPTMNGQVEKMVNEIQKAKKESKHMVGLGIISEATYDNPMIYDLIFDLAWVDDDFDLNTWVKKYLNRRYGGESVNAVNAWDIILDSNYNYGVRLTPEILGLRTGGVPAKLNKKTIGYDIKNLENALRLLVKDFDEFKDSEGYRYDLTEIMRQVTSNYITLKHHEIIDARDNKNIEDFKKAKKEFLNAFDILNLVQSTQKDQLGGEWIGKAEDRAASYDDFSVDIFKMNAKSLITTWGRADDQLTDYGFRTYEGMFLDITKSKWEEYLEQVEAHLETGAEITVPTTSTGYVPFYWKWVIADQEYTRNANNTPENMKEISDRVLKECVFTGELDKNIGNLALNKIVETNGSVLAGELMDLVDGEEETEVQLKNDDCEIIIDLYAEFVLSEIDVITSDVNSFDVYTSSNKKDWKKIDETIVSGDDHEFKISELGRYIRITSKNSQLSLKEVRAYGEQMLPTLEQLKTLLDFANGLTPNTPDDAALDSFNKALKEAQDAYDREAEPDTVNVVYWKLYDAIVELDLTAKVNLALNKDTKATNDPDGHSSGMVDGDFNTNWNSGRLSYPGKPYDHDSLIPAENVVDLKDIYDIEEIRVYFSNQNIWYQYELLGSLDGEHWEKIGEKKTEKLPNENEDFYTLKNPKKYRYIMLKNTNVQVGNDGKRSNVNVSELQVFGYKEADKEALKALIEEARGKDKNYYTLESWKDFEEELENAQFILDDQKATQEKVNMGCTLLDEAMKGLTYKSADYTKIDDALKKIPSDLSKYTDESIKKLNSAINSIKRDLDIRHQKEVDAMAEAIYEALNTLEYRAADYTEMNKAIQKAENLKKGDYTEESWKALEEAMNKAKEVYGLDIRNQKRVDEATAYLKAAIEDLKEKEGKVEKDELYELLETYGGYRSESYTKESWKVFKKAYEKAKGVYENREATQEEVDKAVEELNAAGNQLVKAEIKKPEVGNEEDEKKPEKGEENKENGVQTGVRANAGAFIGMAAIAGGAILLAMKKRREEK